MSSRRKGRSAPPAHPPIIAGRVPPHDLDAEASVLSAILLVGLAALDAVIEILKPLHFYADANGMIFAAALALAERHAPIDITTVAGELRNREQLAKAGGAEYLARLADATPAVANVAAHARIVYEKWRLRALIATCQRVAAEGYGDVGDPQAFIDGAEQAVYELARTSQESRSVTVRQSLAASFSRMVLAAERGGITGTSTGLERIDALTAGVRDGELTIVAARPGMGKSALCTNIAVNIAAPRPVVGADRVETLVDGDGVYVFSLEMPHEQVSQRMVCSEARVDGDRVRHGRLTPDDWRKLTEAAGWLAPLPIRIDDTPALGLLELRAKVRRFMAEYNRPATATTPERKVRLVVVDYIQLMGVREDAATRDQAIGDLSRGLKQLAKELGVHVMALSQVNRAVETRADKRPLLSDLRESGNLEQDADNVWFLYRDEYYTKEASKLRGIAELNIAKQRDGSTGKALLKFTAHCARFDNLSAAEYPDDLDLEAA